MYYEVIVRDHISECECTVGQLLSMAEAIRLVRVLQEFQCCDVYVKEYHWQTKKGRKVVYV